MPRQAAGRAAANKRPAASPPATAEQRVAREAPRSGDSRQPEPRTERQGHTQLPASGTDTGRRTSATSGLYPWIGFRASERVNVWTFASYGASGLLLSPGGGGAIETGLSIAMAAGSGSNELVAEDNGFGLTFKGDAL